MPAECKDWGKESTDTAVGPPQAPAPPVAASFGEGAVALAGGAAVGAGSAYALGAVAGVCWPCAAVIGVGAVGYFAYDLATGGAERIADSAGRVYRLEPTTGDLFTVGSLVGGVGAGSNIARAAISGASRSTVSLNAGRMTTVDLGVVLGSGISLPVRMATTRAAPSGYSVAFEATLTPRGVGTYPAHFAEANARLLAAMGNPELATALRTTLGANFEGTVVSAAGNVRGISPAGWTWHHVPGRPGVLQLVPAGQHAPGSAWQGILHPKGEGGMAEWGWLY